MKLSGYSHILHLVTLLSCSLLLVVVLTACGGGGSSSTSTPTPTPTVKPSPTPSPTPAVSFTTYRDVGYTIDHPLDWREVPTTNGISFTDPTGLYNVTVVAVSDPNGAASADTILNTTVNALKNAMKNPQTMNVAPTTMIGGDTWLQKSFMATTASKGQNVTLQIVFVSDNHPANTASTMNFTIFYGSPPSSFASANSTYFQSMLQSFKFTS